MDLLSVQPYAGVLFWVSLVLFASLFVVVRRAHAAPRTRNLYMVLVSAAMIGLAQKQYWYILLFLLALTLLVYVTGKALGAENAGNRRTLVAGIVMAVVVSVLGYFKYSAVQGAVDLVLDSIAGKSVRGGLPGKHIFFLGVSYFSFKFIHFLIEAHNRKIRTFDLLTFMNYTLFFPSFFGGPINRYQGFADNVHGGAAAPLDWVAGIKRIINGLFKKTVLAGLFLKHSVTGIDLADPSLSVWSLCLSVYAFMFYAYFDFSGYTDMAIGSGKLVGIDLPENFNYPFLKRNLQQFWANWHMSLTSWLTDYIYWPLVRKMRKVGSLAKYPVTNSSICIVVTFMVCGVWHGDAVNFFVWGLYHGVGLTILNMYGYVVKKHFSAKMKEFVHTSRVAYAISTLVTFQFVAFGFLIFSSDMQRLRAILTAVAA